VPSASDSARSPLAGGQQRHLLVVCTANVCRSPVIERLLQRSLDDGAQRRDWEVRSAGTRAGVVAEPQDHTLAAARAAGLDLADHRPRALTAELLRRDGADLVITAEREHVRAVIGLDPDAFSRTFTLRELARRAAASVVSHHHFEDWLQAMAVDRPASATIATDRFDDLADPFGRSRAEHDEMVATAARLVRQIVASGPWHSDAPRSRAC
jgi:protein-tyrosine phosphatase